MKQFTSKDQTATLIELGFEKPRSSVECELPKGDSRIGQVGIRKAYSIGELLSFLPKEIKVVKYDEPAYIQMLCDEEGVWEVGYTFYGNGMGIERNIEFIDCLFQICIKLKEKGVI